jgi:hypothetical protein
VREGAKQLNTSVNPAVMQARAEEEHFSTRIALTFSMGDSALLSQEHVLPTYHFTF